MRQNLTLLFRTHAPPLFLGMGITLSMILVAWFYYNTPEIEKDHPLYKVVDSLHNQTIDTKMRARGPQIEDTDLAVIAIDDRSLEYVGRWPWPRHIVSQLIEELYELGVKSVGLDVIFSEESNQQVQNVLKTLPNIEGLDENAKSKVAAFAENKATVYDYDGRMAQVFKEHQDNLVAAAIYGLNRIPFLPYQSLCFEIMYREMASYNVWDREGYDFIHLINDDSVKVYEELPLPIEDEIMQNMNAIASQQTEAFCAKRQGVQCPEALNNVTRIKLDKEIAHEQRLYCSKWLIPNEDPFYIKLKDNWPNVSSKSPELRDRSFEDFTQDIRTSGLNSALLPVDHWTNNIPSIQDSIRRTGFLNVHPDLDGVIRKVPLLARTGMHIIPSMGLRVASSLVGADGGQITLKKNPLNPSFFEVSDFELTRDAEVIHKIASDQQGHARLNFRGPRYSFPHVSAKELLELDEDKILVTRLENNAGKLNVIRNQERSKEFLKGKSVIIGTSAIGIYDLRVTPFDENYPGVEAHVTVVDNIIKNRMLRSLRDEPPYMILGLLLGGLLLTVALSVIGSVLGLLISSSAIIGMALADYFWLFKNGIVITLIFPLGLATFLYVGITIFKYFTEEKKKRVLRGTFEKYVSPAIVKEVMHHPDNLRLGGRKEHMSVFFSDVRGFTSISEALDPEALSDLLNLYLTPMTDLVFANNGTLDKYMGDAIMAFFGAPVSSRTHAEDAARCSLAHLKRLNELNIELKENDLPTIDIGIGLNTGEMSVGNMGSESVRSYTVMGDAVNLGARLEGINKQYGTRIIISEFTERELSNKFIRREIDWVKVKGKDQPVKIFELIKEGQPSDDESKKLERFNKGTKLYHEMQFSQALAEFESNVNDFADPVSELYMKRCQDFIESPPPQDWDGVFVMTTK